MHCYKVTLKGDQSKLTLQHVYLSWVQVSLFAFHGLGSILYSSLDKTTPPEHSATMQQSARRNCNGIAICLSRLGVAVCNFPPQTRKVVLWCGSSLEDWMQDARVPLQRLQSMYTEMILLMRKLYQECRLVHGDLSEYNILVDQVACSCLIYLLSPSLKTPSIALQNVPYNIATFMGSELFLAVLYLSDFHSILNCCT